MPTEKTLGQFVVNYVENEDVRQAMLASGKIKDEEVYLVGGDKAPKDGATFTPAIDAAGNLSWSNDGGKPNPETVNLKGRDGTDGSDGADGVSPTLATSTITGGHRITITDANGRKTVDVMDGRDGSAGPAGSDGNDGANGTTFTPKIDANGNLSWSNNGGLPNPATVNIKGPTGNTGSTGLTGKDGTSVTHSWDGTNLIITSASGTSSANLRGPMGLKGETGNPGKDGTSATHSWDGTTLTITSASGTSSSDLKGETGPTGPTGKQGPQGNPGAVGPTGEPGKDGVSATHSWNGTTLTVTSASGTSSANLKGDKGDPGETGPRGATGQTGPQGNPGPAGKDCVSNSFSATLSATGWSGSSQTISNAAIKATQNGFASLAQSFTAEQYKAAAEAGLYISGQANGSLTFSAQGKVPTIGIPVSVILFD